MTEKQYGGATGRGTDKTQRVSSDKLAVRKVKGVVSKEPGFLTEDNSSSEDKIRYESHIKAGKILSEVAKYARTIIKKDMLLLEIANKMEEKMVELGAKPAFPTCLSINEIAAHDTPSYNDERKAHGLLKVDFGTHIDGYAADTAFSLDLDGSEENKKIIEASEKAVQKAIEKISPGATLSEVGKEIENAIKSLSLNPIINLCGHSVERYVLHAGISIPNCENSSNFKIPEGVYAIEPFATPGMGQVRDGKPSGIYKLEKEGQVRDPFAREVLSYIVEEYQTLPFCSRWIQKKFGTRGLLALKRIEDAKILRSYPQLIEVSGKKVSQREHTIIVRNNQKIVITNQ